jgi:hypothetical protein
MVLGLAQPLTEMNSRNLLEGKGWLVHKVDNFTTICEPAVKKMWQLQHLTPLWATIACYRDSFTFFLFFLPILQMQKI